MSLSRKAAAWVRWRDCHVRQTAATLVDSASGFTALDDSTATPLQRRLGNRLDLTIQRPADPLDEAGSRATQHFGLKTRKVETNTPSGRELAEVFLGVGARNGSRQQCPRRHSLRSGHQPERRRVPTVRDGSRCSA